MSNLVRVEDFEAADPELIALVMTESDKRIASQVQIMLAADARANGLLAAATALAGAGIAVAADQTQAQALTPLFFAAAAFAVIAVGAAACCIWALWPMGVDVPGWSPRLFRGDVGKDLSRVYSEVVCKNQEKINTNERCNAELSRRAKLAMGLLVLAPIAAACAAGFGAGGLGSLVGAMLLVGVIAYVGVVLRPLVGAK